MKRIYHTPQVDIVPLDLLELIAGSTHATIPAAGWDNAASRRNDWEDYEDK